MGPGGDDGAAIARLTVDRAREKARDAHPNRPRRRPRRPAGRSRPSPAFAISACRSYSEARRCRQKWARDNRSCRKRPGRPSQDSTSRLRSRAEGERKGAWRGMASAPPTPASLVARVMKALARDVLAAIDRVVGGGGGVVRPAVAFVRRPRRGSVGRRPGAGRQDGRGWPERLRRELSELEAIVGGAGEARGPIDARGARRARRVARRRPRHPPRRDPPCRRRRGERRDVSPVGGRRAGRAPRRRGERTRRAAEGRRRSRRPRRASWDSRPRRRRPPSRFARARATMARGAREGTEDARRDGRVPRDDEEDRGRVRRGSGRGARRGREAPEAAGDTGGARAVGAVGGIRVFRARRARGAQTDAAAGEVPPAVVDTQESRDDGEGGVARRRGARRGTRRLRRGVAKRVSWKPRRGSPRAWRRHGRGYGRDGATAAGTRTWAPRSYLGTPAHAGVSAGGGG